MGAKNRGGESTERARDRLGEYGTGRTKYKMHCIESRK
jgi:hypothetical protein